MINNDVICNLRKTNENIKPYLISVGVGLSVFSINCKEDSMSFIMELNDKSYRQIEYVFLYVRSVGAAVRLTVYLSLLSCL